jgi:hypothetical protein
MAERHFYTITSATSARYARDHLHYYLMMSFICYAMNSTIKLYVVKVVARSFLSLDVVD